MLRGVRIIKGERFIRYYGGNRKIVSEGRQKLINMGKHVRVFKEKIGWGLYADGPFVTLR